MTLSPEKSKRGILLIQPRSSLLDLKKNKPGPPYGILSAMRLLPRDLPIRLLDQRLDHPFEPRLAEALRDNPLFAGITTIAGPMIRHALEITTMVKRLSPATPVIWGGPHSLVAGELAAAHPLIDAVVEGEGEKTLAEIVQALSNGSALGEVKGIWIKRNNRPVLTGDRPLLDLETLPFVAYGLVGDRYFYPSAGRPTAYLETSRGCPHRCLFCYHSVKRQPWRAVSAEYAVMAMEALISENPSVRHLYLTDDNYFQQKERVLEIVQGLLRKRMDLTYQVQGAALADLERFTEQEIKTLAASGCSRVDIGAETASPEMAKKLGKPMDISVLHRIAGWLSKAGILPWINFMAGFPEESAEDFSLTLKEIGRLVEEFPKIMISPLYSYYPYPGTKMYEQSVERGFQAPREIASLAESSWRKPGTPWLSGKKQAVLDRVYFYTIFIDNKVTYYRPGMAARVLLGLFKPLARWRLKTKQFGLPLEKWIFEWFFGSEY